MSIMSYFSDDMVVADITRITISNVNGVPATAEAPVVTTECLFWEGSAAQALVSDRFRDMTSAVIGVSVDVDIQENDVVHVDGVKYHALSPDNIGKADEVVIVALEVFA